MFNNIKEFGTKRFQFLKILIIKPFKSIIKCEKRTKQNSDYQKTSFVRFLYLRSDFCPSLFCPLFNLKRIDLNFKIEVERSTFDLFIIYSNTQSTTTLHYSKEVETRSQPLFVAIT